MPSKASLSYKFGGKSADNEVANGEVMQGLSFKTIDSSDCRNGDITTRQTCQDSWATPATSSSSDPDDELDLKHKLSISNLGTVLKGTDVGAGNQLAKVAGENNDESARDNSVSDTTIASVGVSGGSNSHEVISKGDAKNLTAAFQGRDNEAFERDDDVTVMEKNNNTNGTGSHIYLKEMTDTCRIKDSIFLKMSPEEIKHYRDRRDSYFRNEFLIRGRYFCFLILVVNL